MGVTSGQVLLCPLWVDLLPDLNLEHLPQCRNSWIFPTEAPLMLTQMCIFNFANCWRLNADTTNEHWFNQEIKQRQERTERGNRDNLISRTKAWLPPSCGNSTVHLWDLPLCKELPPSFLPEKGKRLEKPELLGRKWWCLSQAKTNYGAAKGRISERISERAREFSVWEPPRAVLVSAHGALAAHPQQLFKGCSSFCFPAHPSSLLCWAPGFLSRAGTLPVSRNICAAHSQERWDIRFISFFLNSPAQSKIAHFGESFKWEYDT